jgi:hypothetical protein
MGLTTCQPDVGDSVEMNLSSPQMRARPVCQLIPARGYCGVHEGGLQMEEAQGETSREISRVMNPWRLYNWGDMLVEL